MTIEFTDFLVAITRLDEMIFGSQQAERLGTPLDDRAIGNIAEHISNLSKIFQKAGPDHDFGEFIGLCANAEADLLRPMMNASKVNVIVVRLHQDIMRMAGKRTFMVTRSEFAGYVDQEKLFGEETYIAFPSARYDIRQSGNCLAAECYTAAVFHLMRGVEHGIRAICEDRNISSIPAKNRPIELANWEEMLKELEKAETEIIGFPVTFMRDEQLAFYHGAMMEIRRFKNKFRNAVMHTRDEYDIDEARSAFTHVRAFYQIISTKISEGVPTPRIWV